MRDVLALRDQLRKERQAVEADKAAIENLSSTVEDLAHEVVCESWRDRQQWKNIDMLMKTRITASQCARRIQLIDKVRFQKYPLPVGQQRGNRESAVGVGASQPVPGKLSSVDHPTSELSEFFTLLLHNPEILARVLIYADSCKLDSGPLVEIALSGVYGNYVIPQDGACVLQLLDQLLWAQLPACRQPKLFFRGVACAFTRMLSLFCEGLFAAKTYLAEALHDCVKQILVDDGRLFEFEPAKLWTRLPEAERAELFDENIVPLAHSESVWQDLDLASAKVASYCMLIMQRLTEYLAHLPAGLRWLAGRLELHLVQLKVVKSREEIGPLLSDLMFGCFISPALAMPEAAIVAVDTTISENARYNLTQVARILQGAASASLALKRKQQMAPHLQSVYAKIDLNVFKTFLEKLTQGVDVEAPPPVAAVPCLCRNTVFTTRLELAVLLSYFEKARLPLTSRGLPDRLIPLLDSLMANPFSNPDLSKASDSPPLSGLAVVDERRGRSLSSVALKPKDHGDTSSLKPRRSSQFKSSPSGAGTAPASPRSRRLRRLRSEHFRPPAEVQVIPLQALKPCGHIDLLPIDEVLRRAARSGKIPVAAGKVESFGEATSEELTRDSVSSARHSGLDESALCAQSSAAGSVAVPSDTVSTGSPDQGTGAVFADDSAVTDGGVTDGGVTEVPLAEGVETQTASTADGDVSLSAVSTPSTPSTAGSAGTFGLAADPVQTSSSLSVSMPNLCAAVGMAATNTGNTAAGNAAARSMRRPSEQLSRASSLSSAIPATTHPLAGRPDALDEGLPLGPTVAVEACSSGSEAALELASVSMAHHNVNSASVGSLANSDVGTDDAPSPALPAKSPDHECTPVAVQDDHGNGDVALASPPSTLHLQHHGNNDGAASSVAAFSPQAKLSKNLPESVVSSAQALAGDTAASATMGVKKMTVSDSFRDYCVISSPEEAGAKKLTASVGDESAAATASVWQRMAESRWSLGSAVRRGLAEGGDYGVGRLAMKTWENISRTAELSGTLLRRMSVGASTEMLAARQRAHGNDDLEAWLKAAAVVQVDRFAEITTQESWERLPLFNLLRWRVRALLSEQSESGLADIAVAGTSPDTAAEPIRVSSPTGLSRLARQSVSSRGATPHTAPGPTYALFDAMPTFSDPQVSQLFRCLGQHLNTSRYMNNQESCTVVHDTINLLKQLPERGLQYLLEVLDRDYQQRRHYHVYLYGVKQQLLFMHNFLQSTLRHIDRHQHCSLQFFMATCVRLFLEQLTGSLEQFVVKFDQLTQSTEKALAMESFLSDVYTRMDEDPMWSASQEHLYAAAQLSLERTCYARVYDTAFRPRGDKDREDDQELCDRIDCLARIITVRHRALQIPEKYCRQAPWPAAVELLSHLNLYKAPYDKLSVVHACCQSIMRSLAVPCLPDDVSPASYAFLGDDCGLHSEAPGADDFFPVMVYVVLCANPPALVSTVNFVNNFHGNRLFGEVSYCWTQFCTAVEFIKMIEL